MQMSQCMAIVQGKGMWYVMLYLPWAEDEWGERLEEGAWKQGSSACNIPSWEKNSKSLIKKNLKLFWARAWWLYAIIKQTKKTKLHWLDRGNNVKLSYGFRVICPLAWISMKFAFKKMKRCVCMCVCERVCAGMHEHVAETYKGKVIVKFFWGYTQGSFRRKKGS